ncbi:MAG: ribosome small subunit-dependent GTPase A [Clostridia bacterium]|nr:ribosome small subunit-dependent GTPase A [Clostridia bacterium]
MVEKNGIIIKGVGGLYTVLIPDEGIYIPSRARGIFRHKDITPQVGDRVAVEYDDSKDVPSDGVINDILDRRNVLIRPPIANLDTLFVVLSVSKPVTITETADKLIAAAEHYSTEPIIIITKKNLDPDEASRLEGIYKKAGFTVFLTDSHDGEGIDEVRDYIIGTAGNGISAFAGASGAGKTTIFNTLFPGLTLKTGTVSHKTGRGRHTTRAVELYPLRELGYPDSPGFLADTPGFSALDFLHFDFFELDELPLNFREFNRYIGECKYKKCTHLCEDGCSIVKAVESGDISLSRHDSYRAMYAELKQRKPWERKN